MGHGGHKKIVCNGNNSCSFIIHKNLPKKIVLSSSVRLVYFLIFTLACGPMESGVTTRIVTVNVLQESAVYFSPLSLTLSVSIPQELEKVPVAFSHELQLWVPTDFKMVIFC